MEKEKVKVPFSSGCLVAGMVFFSIIMIALSIVYITIWRVPDNSATAVKEKAKIQRRFDQAYSLPDQDNGFLFFEKASKTIQTRSVRINEQNVNVDIYTYLDNPIKSQDIPLLEALATQNRNALQLAEEGYSKPHAQVIMEYNKGFSAQVPNFLQLRALSQFLTVMGKWEAVNKNYASSVRYFLLAMKMGEGMIHNGYIIQCMVGIAIQQIPMKPLLTILQESGESPEFYKDLSCQLEEIYKNHPTFAECLEGEFFMAEWGLETLGQPQNMQSFFGRGSSGLIHHLMANRWVIEREKKILQNWYLELKDLLEKEKYSSCTQKIADIYAKIPRFSFCSGYFIPQIERAYIQYCRTTCLIGGIKLLTALKGYYAEKGDYPDSLDSLVPDYISSIPVDPFPDDGKYKYVKAGESVVLYSVSDDLTDDGGFKEAEHIQQPGDLVFFKEKIKKGSINN